MKKLSTLTILILIAISSFSQAPPQAFNYSSIVRGNSGQTLPNKIISFRFTILSGSPTGNIEYQETHLDTTDQWGLVNLAIGTGNVQQGNFAAINWGLNTHYLKIELDDNGGVNFQFMGTTQFLSVPYALYAKSAGDTSFTNRSSILTGGYNMANANQISYSGWSGSPTESRVQFPIPRNGTINNLFIHASGIPVAGCSVTATLMVNGFATALSVTHLSIDGTSVKGNTTTIISVNQGDLISIKFEETAGVGPAQYYKAAFEIK